MLARVVERLRLCRTIDSIVIAAPEGPENEPLAEEARRLETPVWRGSQQDVLARYIGAAEAHDIDPVVRITADCPLLDPFLVDRTVGEYLRLRPQGVDLVCNTWPRRWPRGLDAEVLARSALERAHAVENDPAVREHVTLAIYQRTPPFRVAGLESERDLSGHRWTVDTQDDLAFMRGIYAALGKQIDAQVISTQPIKQDGISHQCTDCGSHDQPNQQGGQVWYQGATAVEQLAQAVPVSGLENEDVA